MLVAVNSRPSVGRFCGDNGAQVQMNPALALMFYFYYLEIVVIFGKELP